MNQANSNINYINYTPEQKGLNNNIFYTSKININNTILPNTNQYFSLPNTEKDRSCPFFFYNQNLNNNEKTKINNPVLSVNSINLVQPPSPNPIMNVNSPKKQSIQNNFLIPPSQPFFQTQQIGFPKIIKRSGPSRNRWTKEEEKRLVKLVSIVGPREWNKIAAFLKNKTAKQCRDHYANCLNPEIRNSLWTVEEEQILLSKYKEYGSQWSKIKPFLPGRTASMIKNYVTMLIKKNNMCISDKFPSSNAFQIPNEQNNANVSSCSSSIESDIEDKNIFLKMTDENKKNTNFNYFDINSLLI